MSNIDFFRKNKYFFNFKIFFRFKMQLTQFIQFFFLFNKI